MNKEDKKALHQEFGIHFKDCPDELQFLESFIDELEEKHLLEFKNKIIKLLTDEYY